MTVVMIVGTFHVCVIWSRRSKVFCKFRFGQHRSINPSFIQPEAETSLTQLLKHDSWYDMNTQMTRAGTTISFEIITFRLLLFLLLLLTLLSITCMQGIYNYIPETNHVSRVHSIAAVLYSQFVLHVMLFRPLNMLHTFTSALSAVRAVPNMAVVCSSLIS
jgi:hypothetical protein